MRRIIFVLALVTSAISASFAQTGAIKGTMVDNTDSTPVRSATITLLLQFDSTIITRAITDSSGNYAFENLSSDSFIVRSSAIGYQEYVAFVNVKDTLRNLGTRGLTKQGKDLSVITIVSRVPPVIQKGDTSQFSASQYKVNPDATTEDLIKKMPGITVDKDGTVTAQGEQVKKVTIDGKEFFGDDASAALKNLPSEVVDKIQVFDKLSDQAQLTGFDDGNSLKAINIVTKTGIKNGQFGRAYAGYGTDNRYAAGGNMSFFKGNRRVSVVGNFNNINQQNFGSQDLLGVTGSANANNNNRGGGRGGRGGGTDNFTVGQASGISKTNAFGINYNDQWGNKLTVSGSYFFNNSENNNESLINTETLGDLKQFSTQDGNTFTKNYNHRINARLEYKLDSSNSIFIIPSLSFQKNSANSFSSFQTYRNLNDSINNSLVNSTADRKGYNIRNTILYRHSFPKKGRSISLGINTNFTKNDGQSITDGRYRFYDEQGIYLSDSAQNQFADNNTNGYTQGLKITYTEPLGKKSQLQFDYTPSIQKNKADQQTYLFDGQKYSQFDTTLSNKFDNTVTTNNAGISYRLSSGRDEQLFFGVSFQHSKLESDRIFPSISSVNQSYSNLLPNAMWRKKLSASGNIRIFYRASTNFPSVIQLQDVVNLNNPLRVSSGNPYLRQSFTHFLAGRFTYTNSKTSRSFFANVFLQAASNYITNANYIATADSTLQHGIVLKEGSQLTVPVNLNGYKTIRSFFTYSMPVKALKTTINLNAGFGYTKLPGILNYTKTVTDNFTYNGGVVLASNISPYVDFNVSYSANFNDATTHSTITTTNNSLNQAAGIQLNLLDKKGWFIQNDVTNQSYSGLSAGLNQSYWLWNAAIGKKFFKNKEGEIKLSVFDLLKQNQSIVRTVTDVIQDSQNQVLERYFLLTFTYNLKNFGKAKVTTRESSNEGRPMGNPGF